jgi:hypothetical protein
LSLFPILGLEQGSSSIKLMDYSAFDCDLPNFFSNKYTFRAAREVSRAFVRDMSNNIVTTSRVLLACLCLAALTVLWRDADMSAADTMMHSTVSMITGAAIIADHHGGGRLKISQIPNQIQNVLGAVDFLKHNFSKTRPQTLEKELPAWVNLCVPDARAAGAPEVTVCVKGINSDAFSSAAFGTASPCYFSGLD